VAQFASCPRDLLCVLCESLAFFAVKFFFTAKLAKNCRQERKAKSRTKGKTEALRSLGSYDRVSRGLAVARKDQQSASLNGSRVLEFLLTAVHCRKQVVQRFRQSWVRKGAIA
jgi:hypothetical protein